jgi:hypothetical protein
MPAVGEADSHSLGTLVLEELYCRDRNEYPKCVCVYTHTHTHTHTHTPHNSPAGGIVQIFWRKRLRPQGTSCIYCVTSIFYDNLQSSSCGIHSETVLASHCQETCTVLPGPTKSQPSKRLEQLSWRKKVINCFLKLSHCALRTLIQRALINVDLANWELAGSELPLCFPPWEDRAPWISCGEGLGPTWENKLSQATWASPILQFVAIWLENDR